MEGRVKRLSVDFETIKAIGGFVFVLWLIKATCS